MPGKVGLLAIDFDAGTLIMTEAGHQTSGVPLRRPGTKRRSPDTTREGSRCWSIDLATFTAALRRENHTLKRTLTDPHLFSGIGNAYSDEILHAARLSPFKQTSALTDEEASRLFECDTVDSVRVDRSAAEGNRE